MPRARTGDIEIYYEVHGQGLPLIMILGLGQDTATLDRSIVIILHKPDGIMTSGSI